MTMHRTLLVFAGLAFANFTPAMSQTSALASSRRVAAAYTPQREITTEPTTVRTVSLKNALTQLEKRYSVSFIYRAELVDMHVQAPVNTSGRLNDDLQKLLIVNNLSSEKVRDNFFIILAKDQKADKTLRQLKRAGVPAENGLQGPLALPGAVLSLENRISHTGLVLNMMIQERTVTGRITDENGEGLPGASVAVKGTSRGTTATAEGTYSISVPSNDAVLVVSFI